MLKRVFLSERGLRAGWSLAIYAVVFGIFILAARSVLRLVLHGGFWAPMASEAGALGAVILASLVMARVERRPWSEFGLPLRLGLSRAPWIGAGWGIGAITGLVALLYASGALRFETIELRGWAIVGFGAAWGVMFLLVGFFEELLLRGYAQFTLARGIGFWPAAILLSGVFGAAHLGNPGESGAGALSAALLGLFLCVTLRRTGNLWFAVGFHAAFDWGESFLYSLPDSGQVVSGHLVRATLQGPRWLTGGTVGPEGSLGCLVVVAALWLAFHLRTRRPGARTK